MRILPILLLSCWCALGQYMPMADPAFLGSIDADTNYPAVAAFTPTDISGLVRWYDAQSITANDNDDIGTWDDKSTANVDFTQETADYKPHYKSSVAAFGNKPALLFDGANDFLTSTRLSDTSQTIFIVTMSDGTVSGSECVLSVGGANEAQVYINSTADWKYYATSAGGVVSASDEQAPTSAGVLYLRYDSDSSVDYRGSSGTAVNFDPNNGYSSSGNTTVGAGPNGASNRFSGHVAEILIYDSGSAGEMTAANMNKVGAYLASKWNFTWTDL